MLEKLVISPSTAFKDAYILFNPCNSKSFAFPKKMVVESLVRPRNDYEKTE